MTGFGARDLAIDLGTTTTVMYVRGRGIVLCEPSLVAVDSGTGELRAVGIDAKRLLDRGASSITAARPLSDGVITDPELAEEMLRQFLHKLYRIRSNHAGRLVVGIPSGATGVEKRALEQACLSIGARHAYLIEAPLAAAIGAGLPVDELAGSLVLDIGGGTSEVALISLGEIVVKRSLRVGGDELDEAIIKHVKREHQLLIGQQTAEEVKLRIGSAFSNRQHAQVEVRGREIGSGVPKAVVVTRREIRGALERPVVKIIDVVKETLARSPPELGSDILDRGVTLAGGGSLLHGLVERLREETQIPVHLTELPLTCVAAGAGSCLRDLS